MAESKKRQIKAKFLYSAKLLAVALLTVALIVFNFSVGDLGPSIEINIIDVFAESAVACLVLVWIVFVLQARLSRKVEFYLYIGFLLIYMGFLQDSLEEFVNLSGHAIWKNILEDIPIPIGALFVSIGFFHWSERQVNLRRVAEQRKSLYKSLSLTDELTGVGNKRAMLMHLDEYVADVNTESQHLAVMMLDLDHFKKLNDKYGHLSGDEVLCYFGKLLRQNIRASDSAFRYGGEEFTLIMPDTMANEAFKVAERIRLELFEKAFLLRGAPSSVHASVSIGIALLRPSEDASNLLNRADGVLYEAKDQGRNRTIGDWMLE